MLHSANCVTRTGGSPANSTRTDTRLRAACANGGMPASGAGGRRGNRHSEVEHPDAWGASLSRRARPWLRNSSA
jgi:hypothetical protein